MPAASPIDFNMESPLTYSGAPTSSPFCEEAYGPIEESNYMFRPIDRPTNADEPLSEVDKASAVKWTSIFTGMDEVALRRGVTLLTLEKENLQQAQLGHTPRFAEVDVQLRIAKQLLHPVRRLPVELVTDIFMWAHAMEEPGPTTLGKFPWNVSLTCKMWRRVAFYFPHFWTQVFFDLDHLSYDTELAQMAFKRSQNNDMDVSINYTMYSQPAMYCFLEDVPTKARWKSLKLNMSQKAIENLSMDGRKYSRLEDLTIAFNYTPPLGHPMPGHISSFSPDLLPVLKRADIHEVEDANIYNTLIGFPFRQLESLSVDVGFFHLGTPSLANTLRHLKRLVIWSATTRSLPIQTLATKMVLPSLTDLEIMDCKRVRSTSMAETVVNSFILPSLDRLVIAFPPGSSPPAFASFPVEHPDLKRVTRLRIEHWTAGSGAWSLSTNLCRLINFLDFMTGVKEVYIEGHDVYRADLVEVFDKSGKNAEWDVGRDTRLPELQILEFAETQRIRDVDGDDSMDEKERENVWRSVLEVAQSRSMDFGPAHRAEEMHGENRLIVPASWEVVDD